MVTASKDENSFFTSSTMSHFINVSASQVLWAQGYRIYTWVTICMKIFLFFFYYFLNVILAVTQCGCSHQDIKHYTNDMF